MASGKPPTIDDVARESGYSVATVSRALRGLPNVAPSTRGIIERVAERMAYQPDPAATSLATGRSRTVAMAVPGLDSWYFGQVMAGVEAVLAEAGYDLHVFSVDSAERRRRTATGPLVKRADGLLLVDLALADIEEHHLAQAGLSVVTVGTTTASFPSVSIDDVGVAELAVSHLADLGHRRIGLLKGETDDPLHFDVPRSRHRGYRNALLRSGLSVDPALERSGNFSVEGGAEAMTELLAIDDPPTAVFAMSDEMAFGAMRALGERGHSVPDDVSIIGVDNHEFSSVIGLTTVDQAVGEQGVAAAHLLIRGMEVGSGDRTGYQVPITLVERRSTTRRR
ncbi:MAG: LacI family DNA-binding transcriptional regulator [Actinomycetota bacterium]